MLKYLLIWSNFADILITWSTVQAKTPPPPPPILFPPEKNVVNRCEQIMKKY